jgi:hypothetical protein
MRIVHIEDFVHPDTGYQVNLLSRLQVRQGHEVFVVTGELDKVPTVYTQFFGKDNIEERDRRFHETTGVRIIRGPLLGCTAAAPFFIRGYSKSSTTSGRMSLSCTGRTS